jgi:hypothetical protein
MFRSDPAICVPMSVPMVMYIDADMGTRCALEDFFEAVISGFHGHTWRAKLLEILSDWGFPDYVPMIGGVPMAKSVFMGTHKGKRLQPWRYQIRSCEISNLGKSPIRKPMKVGCL